jgi:DNA polymerase phi
MTSSHERRYLGLQLLLKVVPNLTADQVGDLICGNWMQCLMNNVTLSERYLHAAAKHILDGLCQSLIQVSDKSVHLAVVLQLLGPNGNRKFDGVSKTKTVATIINMFDVHTLGCYVQFLKLTFNAGKTDHDSLLKEDSCLAASQDVATRQWAIDQMLWLVHNVKLPRQDSWLLDIGKFMLFHAFFTVQDAVEGSLEVEMAPCLSLSPELREFCLQRFVSVLTELSHMPSLHKDTEGQSKGPHGTTSDGEFWLYHLMNFAEGIIQQNGKMSLHQPLSSKAHAALNASSTTIQSIREKAVHETNKAESRTFELLFLYTTLQLFSDQDQSVDVLQDLQTCYGKLQKSKLKGRKRRSLDSKKTAMKW